MTAPARLLSVRLQGFKSFAERTLVTFGPGISAVVGPNGSGKSNLADALRWALGEQGRALRSRRSEDVIWAGSERRAAVGMADVQLTLDNADGLLPVEFEVVELGRRLYRSGENDYLLNRQRVRLRDLVDLLDAGHLAENAFLFIGQGMVDQALALRPEERRPLFEEVAGVHRHERRRRRAEEQLAESEANLARVDDVIAELRPQVRRLAAQAEQQLTRESAGDELVVALLTAARARWHTAARRIADGAVALDAARIEVDAALAGLVAAEARATTAVDAMAERAGSARQLRAEAEAARGELTSIQLDEGRIAAEAGALARDRARISEERAAAEADLATQRRRLADPVPGRDLDLEAAIAEVERALALARAELADLAASADARDAETAAIRRAAVAQADEIDAARRYLADAERRRADEAGRSLALAAAVQEARTTADAAATTHAEAVAARAAAGERRTAAAARLDAAAAAATASEDRVAGLAAAEAAARTRVAAATAALEDERGSTLAEVMRRRGARRVDDGLDVDPAFRAAVDAALAGAARAYLGTREGLLEHAAARGIAVLTGGPATGPDRVPDAAPFVARLAAVGGGHLAEAIRRDPTGAAGRMVARTGWVPDIETALELQPELPPGWLLVVRDGSATVGDVVVRLGTGDGTLERRAELRRAMAEQEAAEAALTGAAELSREAAAVLAAARAALEESGAAEDAANREQRRAEELERHAERRLEAAVREAAWSAAQLERLDGEVARGREAVPADGADAGPLAGGSGSADSAGRGTPRQTDGPSTDAVATWRGRIEELRVRRDRLAARAAEQEAGRQAGERRHAAAEAAIELDDGRIHAADAALGAAADRERSLEAARAALTTRLAAASVRDDAARRAVAALDAADADERTRLAAAEAETATARDRLRGAEELARAAEVGDLEARLGLEALREQLHADLAALGEVSLRHLPDGTARPTPAGPSGRERDPAVPEAPGSARGPAGQITGLEDVEADDEARRLAAALDAAGTVWAAEPAPTEPPSPSRLAVLRRRYHELGAANPFAIEEHGALRVRLDGLERQHDDLRAAIDRTRALVRELDGLISTQFRTTFAALETAFDARFRQLFGGGYARLALTDPTDLAATGVDIVARPPGKKPQPLAMLSGGERALTAVALLFAMLEVRPVPFCVLDEVDAALDEANVGRFTAALRSLAESTQFIVITHNRGTIEIADALYGVTVGDDSISRVISLRLDEATELADRAQRAARPAPGDAVPTG